MIKKEINVKNIMDEIEHDLFGDIYDNAEQDSQLENDGISPEEAAFMQGYNEAG